jgi:hypothetical protein
MRPSNGLVRCSHPSHFLDGSEILWRCSVYVTALNAAMGRCFPSYGYSSPSGRKFL